MKLKIQIQLIAEGKAKTVADTVSQELSVTAKDLQDLRLDLFLLDCMADLDCTLREQKRKEEKLKGKGG